MWPVTAGHSVTETLDAARAKCLRAAMEDAGWVAERTPDHALWALRGPSAKAR